MFAYVVKRLVAGIVVLFLVSLSIFLLFWYGPKDPARPLCDFETSNHCNQDRLATFTEDLGYNKSWYSQYAIFTKGIFLGRTVDISGSAIDCPAPCFGISYTTKNLVWDEMKQKLPATLSVAVGGGFLYLAFGIPLGVAAARRRGTVSDKALVSSFLVLSSVPYYLFALLLWLYFAVKYPVPFIGDTQYNPISQNPGKWFTGLTLAWICLGIFGCTSYTRYTRGAMVESLNEDYVRTAKAKGLPNRTVVYKHALRSALVPVVTIFGIDFGVLLAGTIFTEKIFSIQGIGYWSLNAVRQKNLPIVEATALFAAMALILSNILVDVIYSILDPRGEAVVTLTADSSAPAAPEAHNDDQFLVVEDLSVRFPTEDGLLTAVSGLSYTVKLGQTLGIVGESGSGKSVSSMAVLGLHDSRTAQITGSIRVGGTEVIGLSEQRMRKLRGNAVSMIFQDALAALHPFYKVGGQLAEAYLVHHPDASKRDARRKAIEMLDRVGIPQPDRRVDDFPHQFSGGMRQRAMIAMGLINDPSLLIADEPTTALDVTVQAQILDLLQDLQREFNSAVVIITHDLGVIAEMADDVLVMYAGRAVEYGPCKELLTHPEMPYTWGLLSSVPDITNDTEVRLIPIPGNPPSLLAPPSGCAFHPRCAHVDKVPGHLCTEKLPDLTPGSRGAGHLKRCHLANADAIYQSEVLPEIAPQLAEES